MGNLQRTSLFLVALAMTAGCSSSGGTTCAYGGQSRSVGLSFPSADGCNTCQCDSSGAVTCTLKACAPDAGTADAVAGSDVTDVTDVTADGAEAAPEAAVDSPTEVAGDAADAPGDAGDANPLCAVGDTFTFGFIGGLVAASDESMLTPSGQYRHTRMRLGADAGTTMCALAADCQIMNSLGLPDIVAGLKDPDVLAALALATAPLYGRDLRPVDGQVYSIKRSDGHGVLVGAACGAGEVGCVPIPDGVRFWALAFQMFDGHMRGSAECRDHL